MMESAVVGVESSPVGAESWPQTGRNVIGSGAVAADAQVGKPELGKRAGVVDGWLEHLGNPAVAQPSRPPP